MKAIGGILALGLAIATGCLHGGPDRLRVEAGPEARYRCAAGMGFTARYYTLSDRSLAFVKLTLPDGRELTLPQVVSASGARFTDEREGLWWIKGDTARFETRATDGQWREPCSDIRVVDVP